MFWLQHVVILLPLRVISCRHGILLGRTLSEELHLPDEFACLNLQEGMRMCWSHHIYAHGGELMRRTSLIVVLIDV